MDSDLEPLFALFGAAVYDCQVLEADFKFLLFLAEKYTNSEPFPRDEDPIDSKYAKLTLSPLLNEATNLNLISSEDAALIEDAKDFRNQLAHDFIVRRAGLLTTPIGRGQVISELRSLRAVIKEASKILERVIDGYLVKLGTSTEKIKSELEQFWHTDDEGASIH